MEQVEQIVFLGVIFTVGVTHVGNLVEVMKKTEIQIIQDTSYCFEWECRVYHWKMSWNEDGIIQEITVGRRNQ